MHSHTMTIPRRISSLALAASTIVFALSGCREKSDVTATHQENPPAAPIVARRAPFDPQISAKTVAFWQDRVRYDSQSAVGYRELAAAYLSLHRQSGDIAHVLRAEQAARRSLAILPRGNKPALYRLSRSLLTQHRFDEALTVINRATPLESDAHRLRADIFLELGRYKEANRALVLSPPERRDPNYNALRARLMEIEGQPLQALQRRRAATEQAEANLDAEAESVAWHHGREAHALANMGRSAQARQSLTKALDIFPNDYRAMSLLAHLAANDHNWAEALKWGRRAIAIVPDPDIFALMGDVYAASGRASLAKEQYQIVEAMSRLARAQGVIYDRQRALFYANHNRRLDEALALARGELKLRRDIYTYDTLAWVCFKKGLLSEAEAASRRALAFGTQDAMLWYHAGMIAHARGQRVQASANLQRALSINPRFHPTAPAQARALLAKIGAPIPAKPSAPR